MRAQLIEDDLQRPNAQSGAEVTCRCEAFSLPCRQDLQRCMMAGQTGMGLDERGTLPPAEGVLLWAMRAWVLARVRAEDIAVEARIEAALGGIDAAEAGCGLCGFMDAVERGGTRPVTVERMCARQLTDDERALLGVFGCVQAGRICEAATALRGMMGPTLVGSALDRACDVTITLAGAGHQLAEPILPDPALRPSLH